MPEDAVTDARGELATAETVFGPEHPYTTKTRAKLAQVLGEAGATEEELPVRRQVLTDLMARNGAHDTDTAVAAHNYGYCLYECGRPEEGVGYLERAIRDIAPFVREDGSALFRLRRNLATVLRAAGRTAEAVALLERILAEQAQDTTVTADDLRAARIALAEDYRMQTGPARERGRARGEQLWLGLLRDQERRAGPDDPESLRLRNKLAVFHASTRQNRKALPLYLRNLADRERVLGPEHRETLLSRSNLAICHQSLGELDAAAALLAPLHEQRSRLLGADHADTLDTLDRYAMCLYRLRRYGEAEERFALLVDARTRLGGADDPARAKYLCWVGLSRYRAGRRLRALEPMRASLTDRERILGADHPDTLLVRHGIGSMLHGLRRFDEAVPLLERTLADRERVLGPGKLETVRTRSLLAKALAAAGRHDESVARRRENHEVLVLERGAGERDSILALTRLADAEEQAQRYRDALAGYASALEIAERVLGPEHPDTVKCRFSVAAHRLCQGSPEAAIPLFEQVLENYRRNFGADDERTLKIRRDLARCHDSAGRADRALDEYRALLADVLRVLPRSDGLRRALGADLARPPAAAWRHREVLAGRRLWQVALGAVVIAETADTGDALDGLYKHRWLAPSDTAAALRESRGIASRYGLLRALRHLASDAGSGSGPECGTGSGCGCGPAWNIAMYVDMVRDGVVAGHLGAAEAWELLEQITEPAAQAYDSWAGFAADYLAGHTDRLGLSDPARPDRPTGHRRKIEAVDRLLDPRNADSPFTRAPWHTARSTARTTAPTAEVHR
jgi:tetratricopeptide (TPR) repeat protein